VRWFFSALLFACAAVLTGCDPGIGITFVNKTSSTLCWYEYERDVGNPDACAEIQPNDKITYSTICESDWDQSVFLTVGVTGEQIYNRTATCGEWEDSGAKVTIDRIDGKFVVTDSLPAPTPTPTPTQ